MKKKLLSLTLCACIALAPATSFGASTSRGTVSIPYPSELIGANALVDAPDPNTLGDVIGNVTFTSTKKISTPTKMGIYANLTASISGTRIKLSGIIPYITDSDSPSNVNKGHFAVLKLTQTAQNASTVITRRITGATKGSTGAYDSEGRLTTWEWDEQSTGDDGQASPTNNATEALTINLDWWDGNTAYFYIGPDSRSGSTKGRCQHSHTTATPQSSLCNEFTSSDYIQYSIDFSDVTLLTEKETDAVTDWWKGACQINADTGALSLDTYMDEFNDLSAKIQSAIKAGPLPKDTIGYTAGNTTGNGNPAVGAGSVPNLRAAYDAVASFYSYAAHASVARAAKTSLQSLLTDINKGGQTVQSLNDLSASFNTIMTSIYADGITDSDLDCAPYGSLNDAIKAARYALADKFHVQSTGLYRTVLARDYDTTKAGAEDITLIRSIVNSIAAGITSTSDFGLTTAKYAQFVKLVNAADLAASDLTGAALTLAADAALTYTGQALTPGVSVKIGDRDIAAESLDITYKNNTDAGTGMVVVKGKEGSGLTGSASLDFEIKPAAITPSLVSLTSTSATIGEGNPGVKVPAGTDYDVTYSKKVGTATATITVSGNYTGTVKKTFILKPAALKGLKAAAGTKKAAVSYTAQAGAKYQIVCKPASGKSKTVKTSLTKKTVTGLKAGTYKIYVRAYVTVGSKTYTGSYASKTVKVK